MKKKLLSFLLVAYTTLSGQVTINMKQFAASVNEFLSFRRYNILPDKGCISKAQADTKAEAEYDIFNRAQLITSDFDEAENE